MALWLCVLPGALHGGDSRQSLCPDASTQSWTLRSVQNSQRAAQRIPANSPRSAAALFPSPAAAGQLKIRVI
ncbi:hypothetical protein Nmel_006257, partial [Mimus melanotis]